MEGLKTARIAIAGIGVGRYTLLELARLGISQFHLTDDPAGLACFGPELEDLVEQARAINPKVVVTCFNAGTHDEGIFKFLEGVSWMIDHLDPEHVGAKLRLHQASRAAGVPSLCCSSLGFGVSIVTFDSATPSFAELSGMKIELSAQQNRERYLSFIVPASAEELISPEMPVFAFAGALGAVEVTKHLVGFGDRVLAPDGLYLNSVENRFERFKAYWRARD